MAEAVCKRLQDPGGRTLRVFCLRISQKPENLFCARFFLCHPGDPVKNALAKSSGLAGKDFLFIPAAGWLVLSAVKKALFLSGGWDGHQPESFVSLFSGELQKAGFVTDVERSLEVLADTARIAAYDLIFPCWTMGSLTKEQSEGLLAAVRGGVGLGGIHGGMGDAFRGNLDFEWMVGGHFVGHPHVGDYTVRIRDFASTITCGLPGTFPYTSEQYYMMCDPAVHVLADTEYVYEGRSCAMPLAWVRPWGSGRVFYCSLGHDPAEFEKFPEALRLAVRGILWAAHSL